MLCKLLLLDVCRKQLTYNLTNANNCTLNPECDEKDTVHVQSPEMFIFLSISLNLCDTLSLSIHSQSFIMSGWHEILKSRIFRAQQSWMLTPASQKENKVRLRACRSTQKASSSVFIYLLTFFIERKKKTTTYKRKTDTKNNYVSFNAQVDVGRQNDIATGFMLIYGQLLKLSIPQVVLILK